MTDIFVAGMTLDEFVAKLRSVGVARVDLDPHGVIRGMDIGPEPAPPVDASANDSPVDENLGAPVVVIRRQVPGLVPREPDNDATR